MNRLTDRASLNRAFELAHSIFRFDQKLRTNALTIVVSALQALDVRLSAQVEADRHNPQKPSKVRWNTAQWFQILILCKSANYEMQQETENETPLSNEDMIIRYLKHLIVGTFRRNSFHVSLGLSRLVYGYSAAEAVAIYDLIIQDPDFSTRKADAYYRARKSKLIEELERRFHRFLKIEEGSRSEKRFVVDPESKQFSPLVVEYLARFTPWDTGCLLPEKLDEWSTIQSLQSSQANQIHALVHPRCFARIADALGLDAPELSLALPRFFINDSIPPDQPDRSSLTDSEIDHIQRNLQDDQEKRKRFKPQSLRVVVDGVETACFIVRQINRVQFKLPPQSTLIEIYGRDRDRELLLGSHVLLRENGDSITEQYGITLEAGQRISLTIDPVGDEWQIEMTYAEGTEVLWWRLLTHRLFGTQGVDRIIPVPVLVIILLAILGLGVAMFFSITRTSEDQIARLEPTPQSEKSPLVTQPSPPPQHVASVPTTTHSPKPSPTGQTTRDQTVTSIKSLAEMHNIYVPGFGSDSFSRVLRDTLIEKLRNRFNVVSDPNEADTAFAASMSQLSPPYRIGEEEVRFVRLQLLNASGEVIWSTNLYRGTATDTAERLYQDLKAAVERAQTKQNRQ